MTGGYVINNVWVCYNYNILLMKSEKYKYDQCGTQTTGLHVMSRSAGVPLIDNLGYPVSIRRMVSRVLVRYIHDKLNNPSNNGDAKF